MCRARLRVRVCVCVSLCVCVCVCVCVYVCARNQGPCCCRFLESVNIESHFGALRKWDTEADVNSFLPTVISFLEGVVEV